MVHFSLQSTVTEASRATGKSVSSHAASNSTKTTETSSKSSQNFGGMKKGFLFSSSSKEAEQSKPPAGISKSSGTANTLGDPNIPCIKPQHPSAKRKEHEISEVQDAMKAGQSLFENKGAYTNIETQFIE